MAKYEYPGNQTALQDLHWILCSDGGRTYLRDLIGGHAASAVLNTKIKRGGAMGGETSLASMTAWNDDHVLQLLGAIAADAAKDGATAEEIQAAVKTALAEGVVKVDITVGSPEAGTQ